MEAQKDSRKDEPGDIFLLPSFPDLTYYWPMASVSKRQEPFYMLR
jgi:hypothetical protein